MNGFAGPVADALRLLPGYLGSHVLVSVTALALGLLVSLPLAISSAHRPALRADRSGSSGADPDALNHVPPKEAPVLRSRTCSCSQSLSPRLFLPPRFHRSA